MSYWTELEKCFFFYSQVALFETLEKNTFGKILVFKTKNLNL